MLRIFLTGLLFTASLLPNTILRAQNTGGISIVVGSESTTTVQLARDLEAALASTDSSVEVTTTDDSIDSIRRLQGSGANKADDTVAGVLGIVPSDILAYLENAEDVSTGSASDRLRYLLPLHAQHVYVFARRSIKSLEDLNGKRVVLGLINSRHWITAKNILRITSVEPAESRLLDIDDGVRAVLSDNADAMFYVDSSPAVAFSDFEKWRPDSQYGRLLQQTHLLPLTEPALLDQYESVTVPANTYFWVEDAVETISTIDMLVSLTVDDEDANEESRRLRCDRLKGLAASIRNSVAGLNESEDQLWTKVQLDGSVQKWKIDACMNNDIAMLKDVTKDETKEKVEELEEVEEVKEEVIGSVLDDDLIDGIKKCLMKGECE